MATVKGAAFVDDEIMRLSANVSEKAFEAFERSQIGARRFARLVRWSIEPRVHIAKNGHVTLRFIDAGTSMTAFIFLDSVTIDYRVSIERKGVDYAPYCQGIDIATNALKMVEAFGVEIFSQYGRKADEKL